MTNTQTTGPAAYGVDVTDYGAIGNGIEDDSRAIQAALDAGGGLVVVPYGTYRLNRGLRIGSRTRLVVHPQARLFLADGAGIDNSVFLLSNRNDGDGDTDIHVEGGIWDGNNPGNPRGADSPHSYTGVLICFTRVRRLSLRSLTVRDAESYFIRLGEVHDFEVGPIRFEAPHLRPNQDGVHLGGFCEDGFIHDLSGVGPGTPNDDVVALNADDANGRAQNLGMLCGPIRRIRVRAVSADDCHTFVRILSVESPIEDVWVEQVSGGCRLSAVNMDACRECRVPLFDPADPALAEGVGAVRRVTLRDFDVYRTAGGNRKPLLDLRTRVSELAVERFNRRERDADPGAPTLLLGSFVPCAAIVETDDPAGFEPLRGLPPAADGHLQRVVSPVGADVLRAGFAVAQGEVFATGGSLRRVLVNPAEL